MIDIKKEQKSKAAARTHRSLFTYKIVSQPIVHSAEERVPLLLDLGFTSFIELTEAQSKRLKPDDIVQSQAKIPSRIVKVPKADKSWLYNYKAYVERVVDGDTLWVRIDLGFRFWVRQKLRLCGLNAPELNTRKGIKVKRFVEGQLQGVSWVVIATTKPDKYDRYLSDIFIPREERLIHLNQVLLDQGFAKPQSTASSVAELKKEEIQTIKSIKSK